MWKYRFIPPFLHTLTSNKSMTLCYKSVCTIDIFIDVTAATTTTTAAAAVVVGDGDDDNGVVIIYHNILSNSLSSENNLIFPYKKYFHTALSLDQVWCVCACMRIYFINTE